MITIKVGNGVVAQHPRSERSCRFRPSSYCIRSDDDSNTGGQEEKTGMDNSVETIHRIMGIIILTHYCGLLSWMQQTIICTYL
jgi:hypothetical protein